MRLTCIPANSAHQHAQVSKSSPALSRALLCMHRRHCRQEPDWMAPSLLLDEYEGAGWALIAELVKGDMSAQELLSNHFVVGVM